MEWPAIENLALYNEVPLTSQDEVYIENMTMTLLTKEIYTRAAKSAIANITIDHEGSGLKARVESFLEHLRGDDDHWSTEYRSVAREFTELMAEARPRSRTLEICRGGLDAVHDLLKYRLPKEKGDTTDQETIILAKDAFVLCKNFGALHTHTVSGTRAPDLDYRFGLLTKAPTHNRDFANADYINKFTLYGRAACSHVNQMRANGQLETSTASLAYHTLTNPDLVAQLAHKTFVVIGCDHHLSPTQSLLRIPGVTVLGIASNTMGLQHVLGYATYNTPDDTTFCYPTISSSNDYSGSENLVLSRGPHVAQWILEHTKAGATRDGTGDGIGAHHDSELVIVPMPLPNWSGNPGPAEAATRWAAASDLILERVLRARSESIKCSVWSYQSSTTCMVVPSASTTKSTELLQNRPVHEPWLHALSRGTILTPTIDENNNNNNNNNNDNSSPSKERQASAASKSSSTTNRVAPNANANHDYSIVNGILTFEGPHHVLSEHIRMWRAMVTQFPDEYHSYVQNDDDNGHDDDDDPNQSLHVFAPFVPLLTPDLISSVDTHLLDPLRVFDTGSASSLLAAVAIAGLVEPIVNRPMPEIETGDDGIEPATPFAMFWNGSVHGGIWNCPYTLNSVSGTTGYVLGKVYEYYYHYYNNSTTAKAKDGTSSSTEIDNSTKSIVDVVPSNVDGQQDLPAIVQERLEMLA
jgi:hypothetical protein